MGAVTIYAVFYSSVLLYLSALLFRRREIN
jgi:hypothetical protein